MKKLLFSTAKKDFEVQTCRSGGPGGQHQNKTDSGVRIIHIPSGAVGESRTSKSQHQNRKLAKERLVKSTKFKLWVSKMVHEIDTGKTIEQHVDDAMNPINIKIEVRDKDGKWIIDL